MSELSVEERLERLERAVDELRALVQQRAEATSPAAAVALPSAHPGVATDLLTGAAAPAALRPATPAAAPRPPIDWVAQGYLWVARAGIALLALGLAFLYRFAVQRGLITPPLRVAFGLLLGTVLMALGTRLHALRERRAYALILLGGGLGILYLSAYAAFGFYALVDAQVALAALAGITLLSIRLAVHREQIL